MVKNVSKSIMLLVTFVFFLSSCSSLQKADSPYQSNENTVRKSTTSNKERVLRSKIATQAKKYKGVRYKYGGKNPKGFDCSGFTSYVMDKANVALSGSSSMQAKTGRKISIRQAKTGDLAFFGKGRKVTHVALILHNGKSGLEVIHATSSKGVIVQNITKSSYWKPRLLFIRDVISP